MLGSEKEIRVNTGRRHSVWRPACPALNRARRGTLSRSSLSLTPVQNKTHDAAQVWDHNCGGFSLRDLEEMSGAMLGGKFSEERKPSQAVTVQCCLLVFAVCYMQCV